MVQTGAIVTAVFVGALLVALLITNGVMNKPNLNNSTEPFNFSMSIEELPSASLNQERLRSSATSLPSTTLGPLRVGDDPAGAVYWQNAQYEPSIAQNPLDSQNIIAAYIDYTPQEARCPFSETRNRTRCIFGDNVSVTGYATSFDGGNTWTRGNIMPNPATGVNETHSDPHVVWGPKRDLNGQFSWSNGARAYFFYICNFNSYLYVTPLCLSYSDDGGMSWSHPKVISIGDNTNQGNLGFCDDFEYPTVDVDPESPYFGRVYYSFARYMGCSVGGSALDVDVGNERRRATAGVYVMSSFSSDGGLTFSAPKKQTPASSNINNGPLLSNYFVNMDVGKGGVVYTSLDRCSELNVISSKNGGVAYGSLVAASKEYCAPLNYGERNITEVLYDNAGWAPGLGPRSILNRVHTVVAEKTHANRVHVIYNQISYNAITKKFHAVLKMADSTNGAASFSAPRTIVDLASQGRSVIWPHARISSDDSVMVAFFITMPEYVADPWTLPGTAQGNVARAEYVYSLDQGATWSAPIPVSNYFDPNAAMRYNFAYGFLGDYVTVDLSRDTVTGRVRAHFIWPDTSDAINCQAAWDFVNDHTLLPFDFYEQCDIDNNPKTFDSNPYYASVLF